jgi:hypothetical protein
MKNKIKQYRPAFFEGFKNEVCEFDSIQDLIEIPFVKNFMELPGFHQFSMSGNKLMASYHKGKEWWVVGFIENKNINLPIWDGGRIKDGI